MRTRLEQKWVGTRQAHYRLLLNSQEIGEAWICKEEDCPDECYIASVEIAEHLRNNGYGKELMIHVLKIAKEQGYKRALLKVRDCNQSAIKLYEGFGFYVYESYDSSRGDGKILKMELYLDQICQNKNSTAMFSSSTSKITAANNCLSKLNTSITVT